MLRAALAVMILSSTAFADRDLCARDVAHHGAPIDLDVQGADLHDVLRLLSDVGKVNLVVADDVAGKVTLKLKAVAWDAATCAIAQVHHLRVTLEGNIILVKRDKS